MIRLVDLVVEQGIGSVLRPWAIKRDGIARNLVEGHGLLTRAQAEHDAREIREGRAAFDIETGRAVPLLSHEGSPIKPDPLLAAVSADTFRRESSLDRAIAAAAFFLKDDAREPPENRPDEDWLQRWRDSAARATRDELAALWGRILAGETVKPGSFSLRTLELLRNLSRHEVDALNSVFALAMNLRYIYRPDSPTLDDFGCPFQHLLLAQELGVIQGLDAFGLTTTLSSTQAAHFSSVLVCHDKILIIRNADAKATVRFTSLSLTTVGRELASLVPHQSNTLYLAKLAEDVQKQGFTVTIADFVRTLPDGQIQFRNESALPSTH